MRSVKEKQWLLLGWHTEDNFNTGKTFSDSFCVSNQCHGWGFQQFNCHYLVYMLRIYQYFTSLKILCGPDNLEDTKIVGCNMLKALKNCVAIYVYVVTWQETSLCSASYKLFIIQFLSSTKSWNWFWWRVIKQNVITISLDAIGWR